jgi:uncharacterized protein YegP (UPF0339 family)
MMRFELYKSSGKFRWRLVAANGEVIAQGQGYTRKEKALEAIDLVRQARGARIDDLTPQSGGGLAKKKKPRPASGPGEER